MINPETLNNRLPRLAAVSSVVYRARLWQGRNANQPDRLGIGHDVDRAVHACFPAWARYTLVTIFPVARYARGYDAVCSLGNGNFRGGRVYLPNRHKIGSALLTGSNPTSFYADCRRFLSDRA